ncbi:cytochrome P450 [Neolentinus lepideus HHB14362 ss-1]|uniref:Cytochrome P450 n=1 Tax=Neolentinus lepideus HHB14362 ss-1 TaxID=1314782 RepID=A0A165SNL3_9AGAM|nr:cytochrome P450 [Neolentinus lepideus HHB14362 ss-1]
MAQSLISSTEAFALLVAIGCAALAFLGKRATVRKNLPPGPKGVPFFGNLFQVPVLRPYPKFREWSRQYGEIFHLKLGPQDVVVLNTADAADELFVKRSNYYSSRAAPHVAHDIMSAGQRMVFLPYDKEWKTARKSLQGTIGPNPSKKLRPQQDLESRVLLYDLLLHGDKSVTQPQVEGPNGEVPENHWFSVIRRYTTSIVMTVMYGKRVHRITNNPYLHKIYDVLANFTHVGQPGNYLADAFPILRKLPDILAPWRLKGRKMHEWEMELWGGLLDDIKVDMKNGVFRDSYVGNYLKERAEKGKEEAPGCGLTDDGWLRDKLLAYTAATVLEAGSDTTASTMQSFILFMLAHPHVLKKVRDEIDRVVGEDRMPNFDDEKDLPYFVACIKETLRRRPPTIMGIPHLADQDDVYEGYYIPKGSTVIGNVWAIHMDPVRYPNPRAYNPDRFYKEGQSTPWSSGPDTQGRDHYVFGWGRRFCQGSYIAEASLFIVLSRILWGIDFQTPTDPKTGNSLVPDINDEEETFTDGFVSIPKIFPVSFKARSEKKAEIIRKSFEEAQAEWQVWGLATDER